MDHFRTTLLSLLALTAGTSTLGALQRPPDRPNIVVYVADDLGWRDAGVYGNAAVRTPSIDRIARSGLLVRYAFVTSPLEGETVVMASGSRQIGCTVVREIRGHRPGSRGSGCCR